MSKFADLAGNQGPRREPPMKLDVDVRCQICFVDVDDAEYYHIDKILKWKCPEGHVSYIEEFRL